MLIIGLSGVSVTLGTVTFTGLSLSAIIGVILNLIINRK